MFRGIESGGPRESDAPAESDTRPPRGDCDTEIRSGADTSSPQDGSVGGHSRRRLLVAAGSATALSGCLGVFGGGGGCDAGEVTVEGPDGESRCVTPVESERSVAEFYGFDRGTIHSASLPEEFLVDNATVTFVYRDTSTDEYSLVVVNGDATSTSDGGGGVAMTVRGASDAQWQVKDGLPDSSFPDYDRYETASGAVGVSESVVWGWNDDRTDGGAVGPLGETFDLEVVHRAEGSVNGETQQRTGLDRWLLVDGADIASPIEVATFDGKTGDVTVGLSTDGG